MSLYRRLIQKTLKENVIPFSGDRNKLSWRKNILEGMTTKDFEYLSGLSISDIQISSILGNIQSTKAQEIVKASADNTDYQFAPEFPGSFVNKIGEPITSELKGELPNSYSKSDIQASLQPSSSLSISDVSQNISSWSTDSNIGGSYGAVNLLSTIQKFDSYPYRGNPNIFADGSYNNYSGRAAGDLVARLVFMRDIKNWMRDIASVKAGGSAGPVIPGWPRGIGNPPTTILYLEYASVYANVIKSYTISTNANGVPTELLFGTPNSIIKVFDFEMRYNSDGFLDFSTWTESEKSAWKDKINSKFPGNTVKTNGYSEYYKNSFGSTSKATSAYDLGAPVLAFLSQLAREIPNAAKSLNNVLTGINPLPSKILNYVINTTSQEKIASALTIAGKITNLESAANMLNTYNKFLDNPTGPGSSSSNRLDVTKQIGSADLKALAYATSGNAYISQELEKLRSGGYSGSQYNSVKENIAHYIDSGVYSAISNSNGLQNSLHNNVQVDMNETLKTGQITLVKDYVFRHGGSVEEAENNPVGKVLNAMGIPLDTAGTGTGLTFYAGFAASSLGLNNAQQYGGVYKSPAMHYKIVIPNSGSVKESYENYSTKQKNISQLNPELYPGQPSPNGFPDNPPPEMINGYHPEFGKRLKWYTKMDDISAKTMSNCPTGNPEIDNLVKKQVKNSTTWSRVKKHFKER